MLAAFTRIVLGVAKFHGPDVVPVELPIAPAALIVIVDAVAGAVYENDHEKVPDAATCGLECVSSPPDSFKPVPAISVPEEAFISIPPYLYVPADMVIVYWPVAPGASVSGPAIVIAMLVR